MRIQYKGGVWKNSEDEILKAAVMKYGQNQWPRIASLLVRKSAKQCKARWYEWLDPGIKKTEWTREEEEKLLHLVKIMPTSWRTIAPMIGRTATQCLEHYEKLLDQAQRGSEASADGAGPSSSTGVSGSGQRPGDSDAFPESRPARPDPVDMDEDELEMLSEARARLANTKGKKAKRKSREKQLEEAKRLAQLQKRRELKAAGVEMKPRRKNRKVTDYATEIPFERAPVPGFYDTQEENDRLAKESTENKQVGKLLQKYKGKSEEQKEEEARKRDNEKRKQLEKVNLPAALGLDKKPDVPRSPPLKRARLSLPAPQLTDFELEQLAKAGGLLNDRLASRNTPENQNGRLSESLGGHFINSVANNPQNPSEPWADVRKRHLETIMSLKSLQTPLRGGDSTPLDLGLESGVTPLRSELRTPNPLATPVSVSHESHEKNRTSEVVQAKKEELRRLRETVRKGLQSLPEPEYDYQIEPADDVAVNGLDVTKEANRDVSFLEDAEEEEARKRNMYEKQIQIEKEKVLSSAAKRCLPLPSGGYGKQNHPETVAYLIHRDIEAYRVLQDHSLGRQSPAAVLRKLKSLRERSVVYESSLEDAKRLIEQEMNKEKDGGQNVINDIVEYLKKSRPLHSFRPQQPWRKPSDARKLGE